MLDLFCWMGAIPVTIGFKLVHHRAPFNDDQYTQFLSTASFDRIAVAFGVEEAAPGGEDKKQLRMAGQEVTMSGQDNWLITIPERMRRDVYIVTHAIGAASLLISTVLTAMDTYRHGSVWVSRVSTGFSVLSAGSTGIAGFLIPRYPIKDVNVAWVGRVTTGVALLGKLLYNGPAQGFFTSRVRFQKLAVENPQQVGTFMNALLILPGLGCTCWHFYELSQAPAGRKRSAAIIEATSNMTSYTARFFQAIAAHTPSPKKEKALAGMIAANFVTAGLLIAVSALDQLEVS
jgi:hypothetical protein